jgi:spore coat polysaccharide biosynthesis protein SpsF (cytidylyltransferase family)
MSLAVPQTAPHSHSGKIIVQASTQSTRLPGKVLMEITPGITMLDLVLQRCKQTKYPVLVSIPSEEQDDHLARIVQRKHKLEVLRLVRKHETMNWKPLLPWFLSDTWVARVTADCPFVDPWLVETCVQGLLLGGQPTLDVCVSRTDRWPQLSRVPPGYDVEVFRVESLVQCEGDLDVLWSKPRVAFLDAPDWSPPGFSCTVDWWHDLLWCRHVYAACKGEVGIERVREWWGRAGVERAGSEAFVRAGLSCA